MIKFDAVLEKFSDAQLWHYYFSVPKTHAEKFITGKDSRVICSINGHPAFQCAIMRASGLHFFINLNQEVRDKLKIGIGDVLHIALEKDESEFGLAFPEEFSEVLAQDPEAKKLFDELTPGRKRNLLYLINKVKTVEIRIHRAIVIAEHLKTHKGKIDFKILNASLSYRNQD